MLRLVSFLRWPLALIAGLALFAGCATLDTKQREWIFQPSSGQTSWPPASAEGMQDVWIEHHSAESGSTVKLHALWLPHERADAPVLLYLHGARRNIWGSTFRMRNMHELGFAVLAVDYRGFGQSTPELPSEAGVLEDARAAWDWLAREQPKRERYIFGHSLGSAVAVHLAAEVDDASGLIVEGSFPSIPALVETSTWGWLPVSVLITQRFDASSRIGKVSVPVLVVHGSDDQLIRPDLGRALYERAPTPKRFVLVDGGSHHNTNALGQAQYGEALRELFGPAL